MSMEWWNCDRNRITLLYSYSEKKKKKKIGNFHSTPLGQYRINGLVYLYVFLPTATKYLQERVLFANILPL